MTELEDYITDYFGFDTQSLKKVMAFFEKESLALMLGLTPETLSRLRRKEIS